ncbi:hypothetical protein AOPFMNJM_2877 [Methylobacterium jeotgali]|uniref:6-hydroxymethylpterin diphosphokinase MptE-like domain-containing protein n=4 Tax=Pseudomonadota TaxID=1224 RepID=A0ABQ4T024_9HYPH|nr:hypothetical protein AOPFMNJM_2877 [Methylobacterium jeotgali]
MSREPIMPTSATTFVTVEPGDADIAAGALVRLLGREGGGPVRVLARAGGMPSAAALAARFGLTAHLLPETPAHPEGAALRGLMAEAAAPGAEAVICATSTPFPMVFRNNEAAPAFNAQLPAVRVLHGLGLRRFRFLDRDGSERISEIPHLLDGFKGRHRGERAFIVGNGPSLRRIDMRLLKDELTFGSNRSFLGYEDWGFPFRYWGISDRLQIEMYKEEYEEGIDRDSVKFFPFEYLHFLKVANACPCEIASDAAFGEQWLRFPHFGERPNALFMSFTVTITLIQIAALMGCDPIVLIGVDHNYPIARVKRRGNDEAFVNPALTTPMRDLQRRSKLGWDYWEGNTATGATHFTDKYVTNKIFVPPRTAWSETAYDYAKLWCDRAGVTILNATPDSHLTSYPRVAYETLF